MRHAQLALELERFGLLAEFSNVCTGIQHGFYAGISIRATATHTVSNLTSANVPGGAAFIRAYLAAEVAEGRMTAFPSQRALESRIGPFRTAPMGLVPKTVNKPGGAPFRLIQHLSYSQPGIPAVNSLIDNNEFPTTWHGFTEMTATVLAAAEDDVAATFDVKAAYRTVPLAPDQQNWFVLAYDGSFYLDHAVCFGARPSAGLWGRIADAIRALAQARGVRVLKWVDDFVVFRSPRGVQFTTDDFTSWSASFGVPWAEDKTKDFSSTPKYVGFIWNIHAKTVRLPDNKRQEGLALLASWLEPTATRTQREAESLHGKMVHWAMVLPLARPFMPSLVRWAASFRSPRRPQRVADSVQRDLEWYRSIMLHTPPELPLRLPDPQSVDWFGDASTSFGVAAHVGVHFAVWRWTPEALRLLQQTQGRRPLHINWAEAVAVELGLLLVAWLGDTARIQLDPHRPIEVVSDNAAVVAAFTKGRSRSRIVNEAIRAGHEIMASRAWLIRPVHIPGVDNVTADALSRGLMPEGQRSRLRAVRTIVPDRLRRWLQECSAEL